MNQRWKLPRWKSKNSQTLKAKDVRNSLTYRVRIWKQVPGSAILRITERLITGFPQKSRLARPLALQPPTSRFRTTEHVHQNQPAMVVSYLDDEGAAQPPAPWLPAAIALDTTWTYILKDAILAPKSGAVWLPDRTPLPEIVGGTDRYSGTQDVRGLARVKPKEVLIGNWINFPSHTYYHFLIEDVPALLSSLNFSKHHLKTDSGIIVSANSPLYVIELMNSLGIKRVHFTESSKVQVEHLVATGFDFGGRVHPTSITQIREHFGLEDLSGSELIYASRVGFRRSPAWEQQLLDKLTTVLPRLKVVLCHQHSLAEQVEIFSKAELVIGTHGAALSNIVFSPSSAKIIEIGTPLNNGDHFWRLASMRRQKYELVWVEEGLSANEAIDEIILRVLDQF